MIQSSVHNNTNDWQINFHNYKPRLRQRNRDYNLNIWKIFKQNSAKSTLGGQRGL